MNHCNFFFFTTYKTLKGTNQGGSGVQLYEGCLCASDGTNPGFGLECFENLGFFRENKKALIPSGWFRIFFFSQNILSCVKGGEKKNHSFTTLTHYFFSSPLFLLLAAWSGTSLKRNALLFFLRRTAGHEIKLKKLNDPQDSNPKHWSGGRNDPQFTSLKIYDSFHHYFAPINAEAERENCSYPIFKDTHILCISSGKTIWKEQQLVSELLHICRQEFLAKTRISCRIKKFLQSQENLAKSRKSCNVKKILIFSKN